MAGGIFTERAFEPNIKCIIFAIIMVLAYLYLSPKPNTYILPIIFVGAYISMAWYDWLYNCDSKMYSGTKGYGASLLDAIFKPQRRAPEPHLKKVTEDPRQKHLAKDQEKEFLKRVYQFHALVIVPILLYIGYKGKKVDERWYGVLLGLGGIAGLYHGTRLFVPREVTSCPK